MLYEHENPLSGSSSLSTLLITLPRRPLSFNVFFVKDPIYCLCNFFSSSLPFYGNSNPGSQGHIARTPPPPQPPSTMVHAFIFIARRSQQFLPSSTRVDLTVHTVGAIYAPILAKESIPWGTRIRENDISSYAFCHQTPGDGAYLCCDKTQIIKSLIIPQRKARPVTVQQEGNKL